MPLTVQENSRTRVWDDVAPKLVATLKNVGVEADVDALAEEIFERMWPDIFKEVLAQANGMFEEGAMVQAVRDKKKSLRENESNNEGN